MSKSEDLQVIVLKEISSYLRCQQAEIELDKRLDSLGIDSLGAITVLYELEDKLGLEIPNEVIETLVTVEDIVSYLDKALARHETS